MRERSSSSGGLFGRRQSKSSLAAMSVSIPRRADGSLGFSLRGCAEHSSLPVIETFKGHSHHRDLHSGDAIIAVNGTTVAGMTKAAVREVLQAAAGPAVLLDILHKPKDVSLNKYMGPLHEQADYATRRIKQDIAQSIYRHTVPCTTREPKPGEVPGRDYHFMSRDEFKRLAKAGEFLEIGVFNEDFYGTLKWAPDGDAQASRQPAPVKQVKFSHALSTPALLTSADKGAENGGEHQAAAALASGDAVGADTAGEHQPAAANGLGAASADKAAAPSFVRASSAPALRAQPRQISLLAHAASPSPLHQPDLQHLHRRDGSVNSSDSLADLETIETEIRRVAAEKRALEQLDRECRERELGPLPPHWKMVYTEDGLEFFVNTSTKQTQWIDPRLQQLQEAGQELPFGWDVVRDDEHGVFFVDHVQQKTSFEAPAGPMTPGKGGAHDTSRASLLERKYVHDATQKALGTARCPSVDSTVTSVTNRLSLQSPLLRPVSAHSGLMDQSALSRANASFMTPMPNYMEIDCHVTRPIEGGFECTILGGYPNNLYIHTVAETSPAFGILRPEDQIVRINGRSTANMTHEQFVEYLQTLRRGETAVFSVHRQIQPHRSVSQAGRASVMTTASSMAASTRHYNPEEDWSILVHLEKEPQELSFGFTIAQDESADGMHFITAVAAGGPADRDGRIQPGDILLMVNDQDIAGLDHEQIVEMVRSRPNTVSLLVFQCSPFSARKHVPVQPTVNQSGVPYEPVRAAAFVNPTEGYLFQQTEGEFVQDMPAAPPPAFAAHVRTMQDQVATAVRKDSLRLKKTERQYERAQESEEQTRRELADLREALSRLQADGGAPDSAQLLQLEEEIRLRSNQLEQQEMQGSLLQTLMEALKGHLARLQELSERMAASEMRLQRDDLHKDLHLSIIDLKAVQDQRRRLTEEVSSLLHRNQADDIQALDVDDVELTGVPVEVQLSYDSAAPPAERNFGFSVKTADSPTKTGSVRSMRSMRSMVSSQFGSEPTHPVLTKVVPGGVAHAAGLRNGDILLAVNARDVADGSVSEIASLIVRSGSTVSVTCVRPKKEAPKDPMADAPEFYAPNLRQRDTDSMMRELMIVHEQTHSENRLIEHLRRLLGDLRQGRVVSLEGNFWKRERLSTDSPQTPLPTPDQPAVIDSFV